MAKKEKTSLPDDGSDNLITILCIAAAFVGSMTLAFVVGIVLQYQSTTAAILPEEAASSQQVTQPTRGQVSQTDTEKDDISDPFGSEYAPDDGEPTGEPADEPEGHEEPPQEIVLPQTDTPSAPSTQTPSLNPGTSTSKTDPPKSSGTTPSNSDSGLKVAGGTSSQPSVPKSGGGGNGNWGEDSTTNEITADLSRTAYWVKSGKSYHFSKDCPSLSRSTNIHTGTLQEALNAGKTDPCNNCAGGS